jgi:hypothetical protein
VSGNKRMCRICTRVVTAVKKTRRIAATINRAKSVNRVNQWQPEACDDAVFSKT